MSNYKQKGEWLGGINALRGIAVLMMMFHHVSGYWGLYTWLGYVGVCIFAVISGFLEGYHHLDKECFAIKGSTLVWRKIKHFLPLHLLMFILALGLMMVDYMKNPIETYSFMAVKIFFNLSFMQAFVPIRKIFFGLNGVEWYLTIYLFFIMLLPRIIKMVQKIKTPIYTLFIITLVQLIYGIVIGNTGLNEDWKLWLIYINPFVRIWDFVEGVLLAKLVLNKKGIGDKNVVDNFPNNRWEINIIELLYISFFVFMTLYGTRLPKYIAMVWIYSTLSLGLVYLFAHNEGFLTRLLSNKYSPFMLLGRAGTELYMMHQVLYSYFFRANNHLFNIPFPWIAFGVVGGVLGCAFLYKAFDNIIRRHKVFWAQ